MTECKEAEYLKNNSTTSLCGNFSLLANRLFQFNVNIFRTCTESTAKAKSKQSNLSAIKKTHHQLFSLLQNICCY